MNHSPKPEPAVPHHRFRQGEFEITVLSDGFITIPGEILVSEGSAAEREATLGRLDTVGDMVRPKANIPLIRAGADLILVDIGGGDRYQPTDGRLAGNLRLAGINAAEITKVVVSHAHPDHIGAMLVADGSLRFPNASYHVGAAEWAFWMDPDYRSNMPAGLHEFVAGAQRDLGAIRDRVTLLKAGDEIVTGLRALDTPGHTPGHLSFELAGGEGLIIAGDVATNEIVSFEHPDWRFGYDADPELGIRTRRRLLDRAAKDRTRLLGYHWAHPGVGHAERDGDAFRFVIAAGS